MVSVNDNDEINDYPVQRLLTQKLWSGVQFRYYPVAMD